MKRMMLGAATAVSLLAGMPAQTAAQGTPGQAAPPAPPAAAARPPLEIGAIAPDFELPGATRYGVLQRPVKLSDYKGDIVVLAFFFKARTKG